MSQPIPAAPTAGATPAPEASSETPGAEALGDPGKRALDAMKAERNAAKAEAAQVKAAMEALQAQIAGREAEHKAAVEAQRVRDEALSAATAQANKRILAAEIKAAAAGKMADPADALRYIDTSSFEVGDDGATDSAAIAKAVQDLLTAKPYLGAATAPVFGQVDAGVRNGANQLGLEAQIEAATKAGNHRQAIALKRQLHAQHNPK